MALGGRTIEEWKHSISLDEFHMWLMYRNKWGLSVNRSIEFGSAIVAQSFRGGKLADYLPNRGDSLPQSTEPISVEAVMQLMPGKVMR